MIRRIVLVAGGLLLAAFFLLSWHYLQPSKLWEATGSLMASPGSLALMTAGYFISFLLKAAAWRIYAGGKRSVFLHLAPLGYSLLVNHLLPVKAGDLVRVGVVARLEEKPWDECLHTVAVMRVMDIASLLLIGWLGISWFGVAWSPGLEWLTAAIALGMAVAGLAGLRAMERKGSKFAAKHLALLGLLKKPQAIGAFFVTAASWVTEGFVLYGVLRGIGVDIAFGVAVWVTAMTIAGQLFHVTPGGIGTYESTMTAALAAHGLSGSVALTAALLSHAYKFLFSFAAGALAWIFVPVGLPEARQWLSRRGQPKG